MLYDNPDLYDALLPASDGQVTFYLTLAQRRDGDFVGGRFSSASASQVCQCQVA